MGSAASTTVQAEFKALPEDKQKEVSTKFDELVKAGKTEEDAVAEIKKAEEGSTAPADAGTEGGDAKKEEEAPAATDAAEATKASEATEATATADAAEAPAPAADAAAADSVVVIVSTFKIQPGKTAEAQKWLTDAEDGIKLTKGFDGFIRAFQLRAPDDGEDAPIRALAEFKDMASLGAYGKYRKENKASVAELLAGPPESEVISGKQAAGSAAGQEAKFFNIAKLPLKEGTGDKYKAWLAGPNGLAFTLGFDGCVSGVSNDEIGQEHVLCGYWTGPEKAVAYKKHRMENQDPDLGQCLAGPPGGSAYMLTPL